MVRGRSFSPCFSLSRFAAILLLAVMGSQARAADADASARKPAPKLSPEIEEKLAEGSKKLCEEKKKEETGRMKSELAEVVKVTGLDEAKQKALEKAMAAAIDTAAQEWADRTVEMIRKSWYGATVEMLDQWLSEIPMAVSNGYGVEYVKAADQPIWKEALAQAFDARQSAAWKAELDDRQRQFEEESKMAISAARGRALEMLTPSIVGKAATLTLALALDEERGKKLEKLADQAAEKAADNTADRTRKVLLSLDAARRKQMGKMNNFYLAPEEKDLPENQTVWTEGLGQILTREESARWQTMQDERLKRRANAMATVLVWVLDQAVAFTSSQREQLLPIAAKLVREQKDLVAERAGFPFQGVNLQSLFQAAAEAKEEDLKPFLDARQIEHWKEESGKRSRTQRYVRPVAKKADAKAATFEPEELENAMSDYLFQLCSRQQEQALSDALLKVEDIARVATVDEKNVKRLQTAARGAVEMEVNGWRDGWESSIRSNMQNATPADFQQRLANMGFNFSRGRRRVQEENRSSLWDAAVAEELSESQRAAWQKEVDARNEFEVRVSVLAVLSEFDRLCLLTDEQRAKLEPVLTARLKEYAQDFQQMFSSTDGAWFLQGYYALTPVAGIPEKEMKAILKEPQWKQWTSTQQFSNGTQYWENIESTHKQRAKSR